ncbi:hypothetical protein [Pseudomonas rhizosphaerae]|uniref:hypothetical protein n=1 Tax=Pseudomonas rhizosphaerae TaxID=216142 RepID=UPI0011DDCDA7|nr:hypothetical protein [Pseudomonas rhizosphaerae]
MRLDKRGEAGRGLRRCYKDRGVGGYGDVSVAAARAVSAGNAECLDERGEAGRDLRRCYKDRGVGGYGDVSVAAARAASAVDGAK